MNDLVKFREEKMKQARIEEFNSIAVLDREQVEGIYMLIQEERAKLMREIATNDNVQERQIIHDVLYELKTVRNKIGSDLNRIARAKIMARKNG